MRISDWSSDVCSSDLARRSRDDRPGETARDPGAAAIAVRIAEEADQAVVELVDAAAAGQRQLVGDVEADLAERGIVAVDAKLLGQPDVAVGAGQIGRASCRERVCQYV